MEGTWATQDGGETGRFKVVAGLGFRAGVWDGCDRVENKECSVDGLMDEWTLKIPCEENLDRLLVK